MKNFLILGSGGREHALAWKLKQSVVCEKLFIAPGNAGTSQCGTNVSLSLFDFEEIKQYCEKEGISIIVVGPEAPLVDGIWDYFQDSNIKIIGPSKVGAQLEGSKSFAKEFMERHNIPTAKYKSFTIDTLESGKAFIDNFTNTVVLKADGLAAGKGVLIIEDKEEAKNALEEMLSGKFGNASTTVVIEEFLDGIEFSVFVLTDGNDYKLFPIAKDYKRIGENDTGLNTGGMGAVSPVSFVDEELMKKVKDQIILPTVNGLKQEKIHYSGFVFIGLIKVDNDPFVIEYNCRLGDPETEVILPRLDGDLGEIFDKMETPDFKNCKCEVHDNFATTVMLVSGGYPEFYEKSKEITGFEDIKCETIFHAGTKKEDGAILTNGGRVIALTAIGNSQSEALAKSMSMAEQISFDKKYYRKDIGFDLS